MVYFYDNLNEYLSLPLYQKLRSKIQAKSAKNIEKSYINDPIVDIRDLDTNNLLIYDENILNYKIRNIVGQKIIQIAQYLKTFDLYLKIYEMYRDFEKQKQDFLMIKNEMKSKYPDLSDEEIYLKTIEFIADPEVSPPHTTGGAVDVILLDKNKNVIDMGSPINYADEISHFYTSKINIDQAKNRYFLRSIFLEHEFAPLTTEWWHFSYGDNYWACFYNKKTLFESI